MYTVAYRACTSRRTQRRSADDHPTGETWWIVWITPLAASQEVREPPGRDRRGSPSPYASWIRRRPRLRRPRPRPTVARNVRALHERVRRPHPCGHSTCFIASSGGAGAALSGQSDRDCTPTIHGPAVAPDNALCGTAPGASRVRFAAVAPLTRPPRTRGAAITGATASFVLFRLGSLRNPARSGGSGLQ